MNPLFMSAINTLLRLTRTCPACKGRQIVKPGLKHETVLCKFCGKPIPPQALKHFK
jgi:transcription elongation factor Elf1